MKIRTVHRRALAWFFAIWVSGVFAPLIFNLTHLVGGAAVVISPHRGGRLFLGLAGWALMLAAGVRYATARQPESTWAGKFLARGDPTFQPGETEVSRPKFIGFVVALMFVALGSVAVDLAFSGIIDDQMQHWFYG
jgi:hypothetical protein